MDTTRIADAARGLRHVFLRDLVLPVSIGVHPHEQAGPQRVRINVDLGVEDDGARKLSRPGVGRDDLRRVVDYEGVANAVRAIVAAGHVMLVETLAERIAEFLPGGPAGAPGAGAGGEARCVRGCSIRRGGDRTPPRGFVHALRRRPANSAAWRNVLTE